MKKSDKERLKKIVSTWNDLHAQMEQRQITPALLLEDEFSQWAVTTPLYNIGEQVYQLSSEFKESHPEQPWNMVAGLRHRLVHDYDGINWTIIVDVLFTDMSAKGILFLLRLGARTFKNKILRCFLQDRNVFVKRVHLFFCFFETFSGFFSCKSAQKAL